MIKTKYLKINSRTPEEYKIKKAVEILKKGGVVAFPTETVYGLAALARNKKAVEKIYRLKKRPAAKQLTVQVDSVKNILKLVSEMPEAGRILLEKFCPGPITLILKSQKGTIGVRIPSHKISLAILRKIKAPLVVTSANVSGGKDLTDAREIKKVFNGKIELIVDGGKSPLGKPSTVVDVTDGKIKIIRTGKIDKKKIEKAGNQTT